MTGYFHTTSSQVQLGLTASMIGLATGQLFFGPLSDKYGRRLPLIVAMGLFLLSTVGCIYSQTIMQFVGWKLIQGMADAGGIVISRSIAADNIPEESSVRFAHPEQALYRGSVGMVIASFFLCIALCAGCSFWIYEILLLGLLSMLGLTFTASNTLAMDSERANAGMASALLGALGFAFGGIVSPLVGLGNIMVSTGVLFFIGSVCALICTRTALHRIFALAQYYRK